MTHSVLLPLIIESYSPDIMLENRSLQFLSKVKNNKNSYVKLCGILTFRGSRSNISNSISHLVYKHNLSRLFNDMQSLRVIPPHEDHLIMAGLIRDLIRLRDSGEDRDQVNNLIWLAGVN